MHWIDSVRARSARPAHSEHTGSGAAAGRISNVQIRVECVRQYTGPGTPRLSAGQIVHTAPGQPAKSAGQRKDADTSRSKLERLKRYLESC